MHQKQQPYIELSTGDGGEAQRIPITSDSISVGRQIGNMLTIEDNEASRFHCVIERVAAGYRVRDLGSRNGTRVNGELIKTALLDERDVISIGKVQIRVIVTETPEMATARMKRAEQDFIKQHTAPKAPPRKPIGSDSQDRTSVV